MNLKTLLRVKNRTAALSVLRACDRAEKTGFAQNAKVHGSTIQVLPDEAYFLRQQYTPWLGKPRKAKSQSKQAAYQRSYRLRKKAQQTPSDDPFFLAACRAAGVKPYEKEATLVHLTLLFYRKHLNDPCFATPEAPKKEKSPPTQRTLRPLIQKPVSMLDLWHETEATYEKQEPIRDQDGLLELKQPVLDSSSFA